MQRHFQRKTERQGERNREKKGKRERERLLSTCMHHKYSPWKELAQDKASGQNSIQVAHTDGMDPQTQTIIYDCQDALAGALGGTRGRMRGH